MALRAAGARSTLAAWTPRGHGPSLGLGRGLLDEAAADPGAALRGAQLVVLAAPPLATLELLDSLAGEWRDALAGEAVVTDVASTKSVVADRAAACSLRFVGGHPMAGREVTGIEGASADLFVGRPWVVTPTAGTAEEDVQRVEWLARASGASPVRLSPPAHDAAVAAISHLPLVMAAALVEAVAADATWHGGAGGAPALAASGWRDTTRLAAGSPEMGAGILATNAAPVAARLRRLRAVIDAWIEALEREGGPDAGALAARLDAARDALRAGRREDGS
jgi:prephenate dehydrogenase